MVPGRRVHRAPHPCLHPLERRGDGGEGQQARRRHRRPPVHVRVVGLALRGRLQLVLPRQGRRSRRRPRLLPGPRRARHLRPGVPRRPADEEQLDNFRREIGGNGLSSYPHPRLMPEFWEFPTVSMGLGPINSIYQARFNRYLHNRRIDDTSGSKVWCFLGDGECDEPETLGSISLAGTRAARQPHLGRQLQPATPRRSGARQRQDHPRARGDVPRRRLERHQGHLGSPSGTSC